MKTFRGKTADHICYYISFFILFGGLIFSLLRQYYDFTLTNKIYPCLFHLATGYPCPGCGSTRAVQALTTFHWIDSFLFNPVILYVTLWFLVFFIGHTIELCYLKLTKKSFSSQKKTFFIPIIHAHINYVYLGISILILQWIVKLLIQWLS